MLYLILFHDSDALKMTPARVRYCLPFHPTCTFAPSPAICWKNPG